jgi:hypothetical protein
MRKIKILLIAVVLSVVVPLNAGKLDGVCERLRIKIIFQRVNRIIGSNEAFVQRELSIMTFLRRLANVVSNKLCERGEEILEERERDKFLWYYSELTKKIEEVGSQIIQKLDSSIIEEDPKESVESLGIPLDNVGLSRLVEVKIDGTYGEYLERQTSAQGRRFSSVDNRL